MHREIRDFLTFMRKEFWEFFTRSISVLDVGSGDVNGTTREYFDKTCKYQGNDVFPGRNVNLVYKTSELPFYKPMFDTIISTECFQHDPEYVESLRKIVSILKPGGMFVFTCASTDRPEHGTKKQSPEFSFGTRGNLSKWKNYYKNLTFEDIASVIPLDDVFSEYRCYYNNVHKDLLFWGIKKGTSFDFPIPEYTSNGTVRVGTSASPAPVASKVEPVAALAHEPVVLKVEPVMKPVAAKVEPVVALAHEPVVAKVEPVVAPEPVVALAHEPVVAAKVQPVVEPVVTLAHEPVAAKVEPVVAKVEPVIAKVEPVVAPVPVPVVALELEPEPEPEPEPETEHEHEHEPVNQPEPILEMD